jgi:hypothetical protein
MRKNILNASKVFFLLAGIVWFIVDIIHCILGGLFFQFVLDLVIWIPVFILMWNLLNRDWGDK